MSLHAGMVVVADGTPDAARRLERVLTSDPGMGVIRHADAGYDEAIDFATRPRRPRAARARPGPARPRGTGSRSRPRGGRRDRGSRACGPSRPRSPAPAPRSGLATPPCPRRRTRRAPSSPRRIAGSPGSARSIISTAPSSIEPHAAARVVPPNDAQAEDASVETLELAGRAPSRNATWWIRTPTMLMRPVRAPRPRSPRRRRHPRPLLRRPLLGRHVHAALPAPLRRRRRGVRVPRRGLRPRARTGSIRRSSRAT